MPNALRFRQWKTPKQTGECARLKVVHGPDSGCVFVVTAMKFSIGRGDENDVVIGDLRASRKHAELIRQASGLWHLTDLGSQNGVIWNGKITREADLRAGDVVTVGETAFEFVPEESGTRLLSSPPKAISMDHLRGRPGINGVSDVPVAEPERPIPALIAAPPPAIAGLQLPGVGEAAPLTGLAGMSAGSGLDGGAAAKRKKIIYIVLGLVVAASFLYDPPKETGAKDKKKTEETEKALVKKKEVERELASFLPPLPATGPMAAAETFFQEGFREFREQNYLRAQVQFETALQINPGHSLARLYLQQSEQAIDEEISSHLARGRRDFDAGKLRSARAHFEAVMRLLYRDTDNPAYGQAEEQLKAVITLLGPGGAES